MFNLIEYLYLRQKNNLVYYDGLTGAKSRLYYDKVVKPKYNGKEIKVVFIDINSLKVVNDTLGHHEGSKLIRHVARDILDISDTLEVCRIGGDEFIVVCKPNTDLSKLDTVKDVSYGSYVKERYDDLSSAVAKADRIMYKKKKEYKEKQKIEMNNKEDNR